MSYQKLSNYRKTPVNNKEIKQLESNNIKFNENN